MDLLSSSRSLPSAGITGAHHHSGPELVHRLDDKARQEKPRTHQATPPLSRDGGPAPCLLQLADQLVLVLHQASAVHLLGVEHLPQFLGNPLPSALLPFRRDFVKFVLAGLELILQLLQSANRSRLGALGPAFQRSRQLLLRALDRLHGPGPSLRRSPKEKPNSGETTLGLILYCIFIYVLCLCMCVYGHMCVGADM